ncbi:MAG: serine hydrolase [Chloroflexota bacterium]
MSGVGDITDKNGFLILREALRLAKGVAHGYADNGDTAPPIAVSGGSLAAGALRSTIQDLAIYVVANIALGDTKLSSVLQMMQQRQAIGLSQNSAAGLGWNISMPDTPQEQFSKDGSTAGFSSYIAFSKVSRVSFAVVCNGHHVGQIIAPQLHKLLGASALPLDDSE